MNIACLDVGGRRVGVATGRTDTGLASALTTLINDETFQPKLLELIKTEEVDEIVVGLPRGLDGQETAQTREIQQFVVDMRTWLDLPVHWQDEAGTSVQAEAELQARNSRYNKESVDAVAAAIILQDYLDSLRTNRKD